MVTKRKVQIFVDFAMTLLLPLLMAYSMVGEIAHEWLGAAMLALFIVHHVLNFRWFRAVAKGKYTPVRIYSMIINLLLLIDMLALAVSSVILSQSIFSFLHIDGGTAFARILHLLASYWGLALMSIHIGVHWSAIWGRLQKKAKLPIAHWIKKCANICSLLISAYGIYAFFARHLGEYMLLKTQFVFFDFNEKLILFLLDYLAVMVLFAMVGYYLQKLFRK